MTARHADAEQRAALADRCHRLVRFLHEVAVARSERVRTVDEHPLTVWLADIPAGVVLPEHAGAGEVLLTAPAAAALPPPPPIPPILAGRIHLPDTAQADPARPPAWPAAGPGTDIAAGPDPAVPDDDRAEAAYRDWLPGWRIWATRARADAERRALHNTLHAVAARVAQEGDALELVLATGLLTWQPPDGPLIREHLLSTRVSCEIDPVSSDIRVRVPAGRATRLGDGPLLDGLAGFRRERTNHLHERLHNRPPVPLGAHDARLLRDWLALALDVPVDGFEPQDAPPRHHRTARPAPHVTSAPALVLRVRDQASLLTYYERMLEALRGAGPPPLGLVQLVATLDPAERLAWLDAEGATSGAELGADPLLPLPASPEQARVLERLRHDNGVVVEGPPGTGKTHTIANLITALLAEGQRVLVTSQKAQALRVLREKLPPELQRLCVSFTDVEEASGPADGAARVAVRAMDAGGMDGGGLARARRERERAGRGDAAARRGRHGPPPSGLRLPVRAAGVPPPRRPRLPRHAPGGGQRPAGRPGRGGRARFAVECDGDVGPGPAEIAREFDRERELRRAGGGSGGSASPTSNSTRRRRWPRCGHVWRLPESLRSRPSGTASTAGVRRAARPPSAGRPGPARTSCCTVGARSPLRAGGPRRRADAGRRGRSGRCPALPGHRRPGRLIIDCCRPGRERSGRRPTDPTDPTDPVGLERRGDDVRVSGARTGIALDAVVAAVAAVTRVVTRVGGADDADERRPVQPGLRRRRLGEVRPVDAAERARRPGAQPAHPDVRRRRQVGQRLVGLC